MEQKIRIGICGYGNLGKGVQKAISQNSDMELVAVFTRRDPAQISKQTSVKVLPISEVAQWMNQIDVMIMCGGSATDLPDQVPTLAKLFCTVDSFDTHAKIPQYLSAIFSQITPIIKIAIHTGIMLTKSKYGSP